MAKKDQPEVLADQPDPEPTPEELLARARGEYAILESRHRALMRDLEPFAFPSLRLSGTPNASHNIQVPEAFIAAARAALAG